jgi:hypothetical protein
MNLAGNNHETTSKMLNIIQNGLFFSSSLTKSCLLAELMQFLTDIQMLN